MLFADSVPTLFFVACIFSHYLQIQYLQISFYLQILILQIVYDLQINYLQSMCYLQIQYWQCCLSFACWGLICGYSIYKSFYIYRYCIYKLFIICRYSIYKLCFICRFSTSSFLLFTYSVIIYRYIFLFIHHFLFTDTLSSIVYYLEIQYLQIMCYLQIQHRQCFLLFVYWVVIYRYSIYNSFFSQILDLQIID